MTKPLKYSDTELFGILAGDVQLPNGIDEYSYETSIKPNKSLKWKVNPFLFSSKLRSQLLDESSAKIINRIGYLNWIVVILIVTFSFFTNHHLFLLILLVYPFFKTSGLLDNGVILILTATVSLLSFKFTNIYFISGFIVYMLAYFISKLQFELLKKRIFIIAFGDFKSFWKYYSNKLIYIDKSGLNNKYKDLFERYPDLNIN
jgi:hypothetical protein